MITSGDVANIIYRDCVGFGVPVYKFGNFPTGEVNNEYITVRAKSQETGIYWNKGFVEVNFVVPDIQGDGKLVANTKRMTEVERLMAAKLDDYAGTFDASIYNYSVYSTSHEEDAALKCHFVNCRLLFKVLNTK